MIPGSTDDLSQDKEPSESQLAHEVLEDDENRIPGVEGTVNDTKDDADDSLVNLLTDFDTIDATPPAPDVTEQPNLFDQPGKVVALGELQDELKQRSLTAAKYLLGFDNTVKDDSLCIGAISLEDVQKEELKLREQHLTYESQELAKARKLREALIIAEREVKQRIANDFKEKRLQIQRDKEMLENVKRMAQDEIHTTFKKSEQQMVDIMEKREAEIKTMYGDLQLVSGIFDGSEGRRWKVDWTHSPQPVQIKLITLRGVRDKIPAGRYVVLASLYNRLGGQLMRWSKLKDQTWGSASIPMRHNGNFSSPELKINQSVFTVLPPRHSVSPSMVICFELFLLRGGCVNSDTVVGWAAVPICDGRFHLIDGKYKIPMLRGYMDRSVDKHADIEKMVAHDLDNWLANLYIEIVRLPRYIEGQKEFEVELQFCSNLLNFPDRLDLQRSIEWPTDGQDPRWTITESQMDVQESGHVIAPPSNPAGQLGHRRELVAPSTESDSVYHSDPTRDSLDDVDPGARKRKKNQTKSPGIFGTLLAPSFNSSRVVTAREHPPPYQPIGDKLTLTNEKKARLQIDRSGEAMLNLGDLDDDKYRPVLDQPGVYYKTYQKTPRDDYMSVVNSFLPRTPVMRQRQETKYTRKTRIQMLEQHTYSIKPRVDQSGRPVSEMTNRTAFFLRMLLHELGLARWRSGEFWILLFFLLFSFFLRMYIHYCGQWIYLTLLGTPINKFNFLPYSVELHYQWTLLSITQDAAVVVLGPASNILILLIFMAISGISQAAVGRFPDLGSQFILAFATLTFLDPLLILIVDSCMKRHENLAIQQIGDASKLYYHFIPTDGSGIPGIILTIIIYLALATLCVCLLYVYILRLHKEGRILDIYWRLHGSENRFFVPFDLEISPQELAYHVTKADQWRGEEGERRKVNVIDYEWQMEPSLNDPTRGARVEVTTHVIIETVHLDGLREPYRQFLRLPEGAIVEIVGSYLGIPEDDQFTQLLKAIQSNQKGNDDSRQENQEGIRSQSVVSSEVQLDSTTQNGPMTSSNVQQEKRKPTTSVKAKERSKVKSSPRPKTSKRRKSITASESVA